MKIRFFLFSLLFSLIIPTSFAFSISDDQAKFEKAFDDAHEVTRNHYPRREITTASIDGRFTFVANIAEFESKSVYKYESDNRSVDLPTISEKVYLIVIGDRYLEKIENGPWGCTDVSFTGTRRLGVGYFDPMEELIDLYHFDEVMENSRTIKRFTHKTFHKSTNTIKSENSFLIDEKGQLIEKIYFSDQKRITTKYEYNISLSKITIPDGLENSHCPLYW